MNTSKIVMKLRGREAIAWAAANGRTTVYKYADPVDGARRVSLSEAEEIAKEDPSLIRVAIQEKQNEQQN